MATIADNNNKVRSGLKLGLDSGILGHPERHILGTIPQHHALCLHQAGKVMVSIRVDIVDVMPVLPHRLSAQENLDLPDQSGCLGWVPHTDWAWTHRVSTVMFQTE